MEAIATAVLVADLILSGGVIVLDADGSARSDAVAVHRGRVVALGAADVEKLKGPRTRVVDLRGAAVLPGFIDAHAHLLGLARSLAVVDLKGSESFDEVVRRVVARAKTTKGGEWIVGRGWDQNLWGQKELPHHEALSRATPAHPVYLGRIDGHAALLNRVALAAVGLDGARARAVKDPAGGRIVRDVAGEATGVLIDKAIDLVEGKIPRTHGAALKPLLKRAMERVAAAGIVAVHEMGVTEGDLALLREVAAKGDLSVRLVVYVDGEDDATFRAHEASGPDVGRAAHPLLMVRGVKLFADGALGSRGAALLEPYSDDGKNSGLLLKDERGLAELVRRATKARLQVAIHAIGDRANRVALNAIEAQKDAKPERPRIEHAQVVHPDDVKRFAALGVVASMQPTHCTSDMTWAEKRLGGARIARAYAWRSMIEANVPLAFGSDFPVEEVEPIAGLVAATSRADQDGFPAGGWNPWQRLTAKQAVAAFTRGAAFAAFEEGEAGTIAIGRRADFVVLSEDPLTRSAADLSDQRVLMTIVGGRVVFESSINPI